MAAVIVDENPLNAALFGLEGNGIAIALDSLDEGAMPVPDGGPGDALTDMRRRLKDTLANEPDGPVRRAALER